MDWTAHHTEALSVTIFSTMFSQLIAVCASCGTEGYILFLLFTPLNGIYVKSYDYFAKLVYIDSVLLPILFLTQTEQAYSTEAS